MNAKERTSSIDSTNTVTLSGSSFHGCRTSPKSVIPLMAAMVFAWTTCSLTARAAEAPRTIGIFSPSAAGGTSAGEASLQQTISGAGLAVEVFASLDIATLLKYDIVILPNTRRLPPVLDANWRGNLRAYVRHAGGSILFYHDAVGLPRSPVNYPVALFPEIVPSGESVRVVTHEVRVETDPLLGAFPFLPGYDHGQIARHMYYDHVAFHPASGEVLLSDPESGRAVVLAATSGKGRVVYNGTVGVLPEGADVSEAMTGIDRDILLSTLAWCREGGGQVETDPAGVPCPPWPFEDVKDGLVAHWDFDGHLRDISGNGCDGTWSGDDNAPEASFVEGIPGSGGRALRFDGETPVVLRTGLEFEVSQAHSVSMWLHLPEDAPQEWNAILGANFDSGGFWHFHHRGGNLTHYYTIRDGEGISFPMDIRMGEDVPFGHWFHLVIITEPLEPEPATVNYRVYVNGHLRMDTQADWHHGPKRFRYATLGGAPWRNRGFTGSMGDVRIYDRSLTAEDVTVLHARWPAAADPAEQPPIAVVNFHVLARYHEYGEEKLRRSGLAFETVPTRMLSRLTPERYPLAVIYLDPDADIGAVQQILAYLEAGGQGIVFLPGHYLGPSAEWGPALLAAFGCELGDSYGHGNTFRPSEVFGRFRRIVFTDPDHRPPSMDRLPRLLQTVRPVSETAEVIGGWEDTLNQARVAGVIRSPRGVLVNNLAPAHDDDYPHHLWRFLSFTATTLLPEIAEDVNRNLKAGFAERKEIIRARADTPQGRDYLEAARGLHDEAALFAGRGEIRAANDLLIQADEHLMFAYAVSLRRAEGELRMLSIDERATLHIDPDLELSRIARAGFNAVYRHTGRETHYHSDLFAEPGMTDRDELREWVESAHRHGLMFGISQNPFTIYPRETLHHRAREEDWRIVRLADYGKEPRPMPASLLRESLCRSRPEVTAHAIERAAEIVRRYGPDILMLDVIRWTDPCVCDHCRMRFETETGIRVENWPTGVMDQHYDAFNHWRAGPISDVVRGVSQAIEEARPGTRLGVFSFRDRDSAAFRGQHWWTWIDMVDYIMPMWYSPENDRLATMLEGVADSIPANARASLVPCLAALGYQVIDPLLFLEQMEIQHRIAPAGITYFRHHSFTDADYELLRKGPFRE